jgi:hypothetical protein
MIRLDCTVENRASTLLQTLVQRLGPEGRQELNEGATHEVAVLVRTHILDAAKTRHTTADNIRNGPAGRTGHLTKAGESVEESVSSDEGTVTISSPGFRRALGPVTILPRTRQHLTIPTDAMSYGKTVAEVVRDGVNVFRPKGRNFLATTDKSTRPATLIVLYSLVQSATLRHEPELLPRLDEMQAAGKKGVLNIIRSIVERGAA